MTETTTRITPELSDSQRAWIDGFRDLIDFLEAHPDVIPFSGEHVLKPVLQGDGFARIALQLGNAEKSVEGDYYNVTREFGPHNLKVYAGREFVCERRVVGTEEVQVVGPDPEAVEALPKVLRTETRERIEWLCPESLHSLLGA